MNLILLFLFPLYGIMAEMPKNFKCPKSIEKNGMQISWKFDNENKEIFFDVYAPSQGWLAIGFNDKNTLIGTNVIMGKYQSETSEISDRFIINIGDHQPVEAFDSKSVIRNASISETPSGTSMKFSLPIQKHDNYHFSFVSGKSIYLLLAYSNEDDFTHHSHMRTSIKINL